MLPPATMPRPGEQLTLAIDLAELHLFDEAAAVSRPDRRPRSGRGPQRHEDTKEILFPLTLGSRAYTGAKSQDPWGVSCTAVGSGVSPPRSRPSVFPRRAAGRRTGGGMRLTRGVLCGSMLMAMLLVVRSVAGSGSEARQGRLQGLALLSRSPAVTSMTAATVSGTPQSSRSAPKARSRRSRVRRSTSTTNALVETYSRTKVVRNAETALRSAATPSSSPACGTVTRRSRPARGHNGSSSTPAATLLGRYRQAQEMAQEMVATAAVMADVFHDGALRRLRDLFRHRQGRD